MHDEHPHPLLAQVPLTVSPFLSLPTATTLPYTYKQLPSTLPQSVLQTPNDTDPNQPPAYIVSATGVTATPDSILTSCLALQSHLQQLESSAKRTLKDWEEQRRARDLAEKRRVAPGWLDGDVKILRPEVDDTGASQQGSQDTYMGTVDGHHGASPGPQRRTSVGIKALIEQRDGVQDSRERDEIDRAFGGLDIGK